MRGETFAGTLAPMDLPTGLTSRPLRPDDAERVFELMVASETHDVGEVAMDLEDVVSRWQRPSFDLDAQSVGVISGNELVAFAEVANGRYAEATVPPEWRGRGIGTWLAAWTQTEARRQGGSLVGMPVPEGSDGDRLLARLGYHVAWTSWILELPHGAEIEPQPLPEGYAVRALAPGGRSHDEGAAAHSVEERAVYQVVEDAFNEWPDRTPVPFDDWAADVVLRPGFEPWHLRVVTDPAGEVVGMGYVVMSRDSGFVMSLAVRKDQRNRGLARALLVDCFQVSRADGRSRAEISTDSRTGALALYERVGMHITSTWPHRAIAV
jgi:GNAT superfamily N-acetyltransferase